MGERLPSRHANRNGDWHGFADLNCRFQPHALFIDKRKKPFFESSMNKFTITGYQRHTLSGSLSPNRSPNRADAVGTTPVAS